MNLLLKSSLKLFPFACAAAPLVAQPVWTYEPQHPLTFSTNARSLDQPALFLDLDGDGRNEILLICDPSRSTGDRTIAVLRQAEDGLEFVDQLHVNGGSLAVVPGTGARTLLVHDYEGYTPKLREIGGLPLSILRDVPTDTSMTVKAVADIDGDGALDILSGGWGQAAVFDYETGQQKSLIPDVYGYQLRPSQLDTDLQLEIIVDSTPGLVLDGSSFAIDWQYPAGFGGLLLTGVFEASGIPTFATFAGGQIFRGTPFAALRTLSGLEDTSSIFDFDDDGIDEFVTRAAWSRPIRVIDAVTGGVKASFEAPWDNSVMPVMDRLVPGGERLLVQAATYYIYGPGGVRILDVDSLEERYSAGYEAGPFEAAGLGDPNGDGMIDQVFLGGRQGTGGLIAVLGVRDLEGTLQSERVGVLHDWNVATLNLRMFDLDGQPGDEIVLTEGSHIEAMVAVLDGKTLEDRWRNNGGVGSILEGRGPLAIGAADFDSDGLDDVVLAVRNYTNVRILALSGLTGARLWESVPLHRGNSDIPPQLTVANIDEDLAAEIIVSTPTAIYAFDSVTRLLDWSYYVPEADVAGVHAWGAGTACQFGVVRGNTWHVHRCDDREPVYSQSLPETTTFIEAVDENRFVVGSLGRLYLLDRELGYKRVSGYLGRNLRGMRGNAMLRDSKGRTEILLGSNTLVTRFRIDGHMFWNGFD